MSLRLDTRTKCEGVPDYSSGSCDRERVGDMSDPDLGPVDEHPDDVEPILIVRLTMSVDPDLRRLGQLLLLAPVDCGHRTAEIRPFPRFDLDKRHHSALFD